jgi:hypothetical protein
MSQQEEKVLRDVKSFTVDRSKWFRGQGQAASGLLQKNGSMCCLGFYAEACGVEPQYLLGKSAPALVEDINWETILIQRHTYGRWNTDHCIDLMVINDSIIISDDTRESRLKILFHQIGIEVVFT